MRKPSLRTVTVSLVTLTLPATLLASTLVTAYFKSTNPDNVDITQSLAYLKQSLLVAVITFSLFVIVGIVGIVKMYRRDKNFVKAKFPMTLLIVVFVLMSGAAITNAYTNKVQDQYLIDNGRPTMGQYFDELKKQDSR